MNKFYNWKTKRKKYMVREQMKLILEVNIYNYFLNDQESQQFLKLQKVISL